MSAYKDYVFGIQEDVQSLITEEMVLDSMNIEEFYIKVGTAVEQLPNGQWLLGAYDDIITSVCDSCWNSIYDSKGLIRAGVI
jgi:hypothetical protein